MSPHPTEERGIRHYSHAGYRLGGGMLEPGLDRPSRGHSEGPRGRQGGRSRVLVRL